MNEGERQRSRAETGADKVGQLDLVELKLLVPADVQRAWQRCSWVLVYETGRSRTAIMYEMVHDFLVKHGC
ncbi:MAG: hypothetical protein WBW79_12650 [Desulfocapsaceae bacterium]